MSDMSAVEQLPDSAGTNRRINTAPSWENPCLKFTVELPKRKADDRREPWNCGSEVRLGCVVAFVSVNSFIKFPIQHFEYRKSSPFHTLTGQIMLFLNLLPYNVQIPSCL
jgi:mRNA-degrading endonuclease HigB of HigAB toxin-antitoxin module